MIFICSFVKSMNPKIIIDVSTNGTVFGTEERIEKIIRSGINNIIVSLYCDDSYTSKKYIGNEFRGRIKNVKLIMVKLESIANTVLQKAENIYQSVKGLTQLKTGRMRTLVDSTFHLKGKKVFIKAEEDFKVKGKKIHLG